MKKLTIEFLLDQNAKSRNIVAVSRTDTAKHAAQILTTHNIGIVMVLENDRLVGVLSERDIVHRWVSGPKFPADVKVEDIMTKDVECVTTDDTVYDCYLRFNARKCRHLPILDPMKNVIGVLSMRDVSAYVVDRLSEEETTA
jgi:CBS domain-containing protein